jgi:hypothetical protein
MLLWEVSLHQEKCYFPIGERAYWRSDMMSLKSKRELLEVLRPRYLKANKVEKQKMLDEFTSTTGYHRKHAIRILKNQVQVQNHLNRKTKTCKTIYQGEVTQALEQIWEICGQICSKRLQPYLPEAIKVLERHKEIRLSKDTKELLLKISSASLDRCLRPIRMKSPHGLSTTKPGSLLKNLIPVRTFTEWDEERPGFMEIDLVAHCGNTTEGQYLNTLTCTDISTGWTDVTACRTARKKRFLKPYAGCVKDCLSPCSALIRIMAVSSSITPYIGTVWMSRSLSPVLVHTRKTIRRMSNRRIGLLCDTRLVMTVGKQNRNWLSYKAFMTIYGSTSTSSNPLSS